MMKQVEQVEDVKQVEQVEEVKQGQVETAKLSLDTVDRKQVKLTT